MKATALRVLIVHGSPEARLTLRRLLARAAPDTYTVAEASSGALALAACQAAPPDCLLLDLHLPAAGGLAVLDAIRAHSDLPIVLLADAGDESLAAEALQRGAQDYLITGGLTPVRLHLAVQRASAAVRLARERDQAQDLLAAVLDALPVGAAVLDAELRISQGNPALARLLGQPAAALQGQALTRLWPELAEPCALLPDAAGFRGLELLLPAAAGRDERWLALSGTPLRAAAGAGPLALLTVEDVTARRRAEADRAAAERLQVLADTTRAFAAAGTDEQVVLERVAHWAAATLAGACLIWLRADDPQWLRPATIYDPDQAAQAAIQAFVGQSPLALDAPAPAAQVARSGRPLLLAAVDAEATRAALAPEPWPAFERAGPHSLIIVPLRAHRQTLGCLALARHGGGQPAFTGDDLLLAQGIADRAAPAIANAQLYRRAQDAHQAAAESLARLDALIRSAPSGIGYLDRQLRYQLVNPALAAVNRRTPEEHLGRTPHDLLPGLAPRLEPIMRQVLATGEAARDLELRGAPCPVHGTAHDWLVSYFPVHGPAEAVIGVGVTVTDITESRRTTAALRDTERKLGTLFELLPVGVSILDAAGEVVYVNPALERILRLDRAQLLGGARQAWRYLKPDGTPMPGEEYAGTQAFAERRAVANVETGIITEAGEVIWVSVSAAPVEFPDWRVVVVTTDITARKQAEVRLRAALDAEQRARLAAEAASARTARLQALTAGLAGALAHGDVIQVIASQSAAATGAQTVVVTLLSAADAQLEVAACVGPVVGGERARSIPLEAPWPSAVAARTGAPVWLASRGEAAARVPGFEQAMARLGCHAVAALPLRSYTQVLGAVSFSYAAPTPFHTQERTFLLALTQLCAQAVERANLYREVLASQEQLRHLSRRLLQVQEEERGHLARELHDELGQELTGLRLALELAGRLPPEQREPHLAAARRTTQDLIASVRALALDLRPAILDDSGLLPALLWLSRRFGERTGVAVELHHQGLERRLPPAVEPVAYRVVQEALTNIARHAGVAAATVSVRASPAQLLVQVQDSGRGFAPAAALASGRSSGLAGMRERVALLGGTLSIESEPGAGTWLTAELPLGQEPRAERPEPAGARHAGAGSPDGDGSAASDHARDEESEA